MEVWLVDNQSTDRIREHVEAFCRAFPERTVHRLWNRTNVGFAVGVNQGLARSRGHFLLLLGSDTRVLPGSLERMVGFLEGHPEVGVVAPQLLDPKGRVQVSCRRFPTYADAFLELSGLSRVFPGIVLPRWKMGDFDHFTSRAVDQVEGSCLMTHRRALEAVGPMDERFSMFFNDVDWCRRFWEKGWKVVFYPEARVEHQGGGSVYPHRLPMIWKSHQGFYRYFQKYAASFWQRAFHPFLGLLLVLTAAYRSLLLFFNIDRRKDDGKGHSRKGLEVRR